MAYGRYLEEFQVGEVIRHWPGRTITEADCTWFALLTMNQHPVHSDAHYAATHTQHKQRLVLGPLVFTLSVALTGSSRFAILFIITFFVAGAALLALVNEEEGMRAAGVES